MLHINVLRALPRSGLAGSAGARAVCLAGCALVYAGGVAQAAPAAPALYWAGAYGAGIGRAEPSVGTGGLRLGRSAQITPLDIAARGRHVYWTPNTDRTMIGRATVRGGGLTDVLPRFISLRGQSVESLALDGRNIYFLQGVQHVTVGRVRLDGTKVRRVLARLPGTASGENGLAVAGGYIYWSNVEREAIGRVRTDGSGVQPQFLANVGAVADLATEGRRLFWITPGGVGRASLDGSDVVTFPGIASYTELAVDDRFIYLASYGRGEDEGRWLARATVDGADFQPRFVDTLGLADGDQSLAVTGSAP